MGPTMSLAVLGRSRYTSIRVRPSRAAPTAHAAIYIPTNGLIPCDRTALLPVCEHGYIFLFFPALYPRCRLYNCAFRLFHLSICSLGPLSCSLLCIVSDALALYNLHPHCVVVVDPGLVNLTGSSRKYERLLLTGCLALHAVCDSCYRRR